MNATSTYPPTSATTSANAKSDGAVVVSMPIRHTHRERAFGVGYGNSSGYASTRQYASHWTLPRFKCA